MIFTLIFFLTVFFFFFVLLLKCDVYDIYIFKYIRVCVCIHSKYHQGVGVYVCVCVHVCKREREHVCIHIYSKYPYGLNSFVIDSILTKIILCNLDSGHSLSDCDQYRNICAADKLQYLFLPQNISTWRQS